MPALILVLTLGIWMEFDVFPNQKHKQLHIVILDHFSVCVQITGKQIADKKNTQKANDQTFLMNSTGD